ncbi:DUF3710 domain-containing protein [Streptomyces sp. NPDC002276]
MHPLMAHGRPVGVIVSLGDHAFSLQAFRVPVGPVRRKTLPKIIQGIRDQGGAAEEAESGLGFEVRARIFVVKDEQRLLQPTRIVGCDGPGRLLRGGYGGPAALTDLMDPRARHLFTQTVVDFPEAVCASAPLRLWSRTTTSPTGGLRGAYERLLGAGFDGGSSSTTFSPRTATTRRCSSRGRLRGIPALRGR